MTFHSRRELSWSPDAGLSQLTVALRLSLRAKPQTQTLTFLTSSRRFSASCSASGWTAPLAGPAKAPSL